MIEQMKEIETLKAQLKSQNNISLALQEQRNEAHDMRAQLKANAMLMQEDLQGQIKAKDERIAELEAKVAELEKGPTLHFKRKTNGEVVDVAANS